MKRVLFVASLPTEKMNFDGERNKSRDVLNAIRKMGEVSISIVNYSKNKYFQTIKLLFCALLKNYDYIFVSKCIVGGSFAIHLLNFFQKCKGKVFFYLIGNGYQGFEDTKIYFDDLNLCKKVIVESPMVAESLVTKGIDMERTAIFPCVKPVFHLPQIKKKYPTDTLSLIYFSRINRKKGLDDLLNVVIEINAGLPIPKYRLDIAGGVSYEPEVQQFNEEVLNLCKKYDFLSYLGMNLRIAGIGSYDTLQRYDLHVFPSKYVQECAPGSVLDMFVAGVPTLTSTFPSAKFIMNDNNSFFFEQGNKKDLKEQLEFIYDNQTQLIGKRLASLAESEKYSEEAFIKTLIEIGLAF